MNVLVVDDQEEVVTGLLKGLHWDNMSVEQAYPAYSAEDARQVFKEHTIDIMLCDIEMPRENGLSLFRWVVYEYPQTECIFLTSHAEFSYAQEAISLGSFDYILQPARYEEIEAAIRKARLKVIQRKRMQKIEEVQTYKEEFSDGMASNYLQDMINYPTNAHRDLDKIFLLELKKKYSKLRICLVLQQIVCWKSGYNEWEGMLLRRSILNSIQEIYITYKIEVMLLKYDKQYYVLLICGEEEDLSISNCYSGLAEYHQFEEKYMDFSTALYIGGIIHPTEFLENLNYLVDFSKHNIMRQGKIFILDGKKEDEHSNKIRLFHVERWDELLENGKGQQIKMEIVSYFENPVNQIHNSSEVLIELHCSFTKALFSIFQKNNVDYRNVFNEDYTIDNYMTSYDSYEHFIESIDYILQLQKKEKDESNPLEEEDQIRKAIQYIKDNLDRKLIRKELAAYIYLNEDYLSRLFKKKTGYMLKEFIMVEKIKLAKELLKSTNMSVSLIALKVGFNNFSHFSQVFKKMENLTPNDYRNQYQIMFQSQKSE